MEKLEDRFPNQKRRACKGHSRGNNNLWMSPNRYRNQAEKNVCRKQTIPIDQ